ncbi:MAG: hypothetical protein AAGF75_06905 [Cyanobacteria bacterium P01_H01_bin.130]
MTTTLQDAPGTKAIAELRKYLEQSLHFRWGHYSDNHQPEEDVDEEFDQMGDGRIIYESNPKGAIFVYERARSNDNRVINSSPVTYGNFELGLRVLCSHQRGETALDELLNIEWELEKLSSALIRGDTEFNIAGLLFKKTEFLQVIKSHDGGNGGQAGYVTGGLLSRYVLVNAPPL